MGKHFNILAVHGKAQSGKSTTVAKVIEIFKNEGLKAAEVNFADRLKDAAALIFRIPRELMNTTEGKKTFLPHFKMSVREVLQKFGTEGCRAIYKDIWVWNIKQSIQEFKNQNYDIVCIGDMRFPNEYWAMRAEDAILLKTIRPDHAIQEDSHASENALDNIKVWDSICIAHTPEEVEILAEGLAKDIIEGKYK